MGLALLSKVTAILLAPAFVAAAFVSGRHARSGRRWWAALGVIVVVGIAISGWWFLRKLCLYADLFAHSTFCISADAPPFEFTLTGFRQLTKEFVHDYWLGCVWLPRDCSSVAFIAVMLGLAAVGLFVFWRRFHTPGYEGWPGHLNLWPIPTYSVLLPTGIGWLRMTNELSGAGHARLIYPAGLGLSLLMILGWEGLVGSRRARLLAVLFLVVQGVEAVVRLHVYHQT